MPNVSLHLVLADLALEEWREGRSPAPFPVDDSVCLNSFYHGAFGPDLGYFPGGHPFFSDLAHTVRTGRLTRALLRRSRTDAERAFAWGWVTHVLGDVAIHPLVGLGVGEHLYGDRDRFVSAAAEKVAHVRVEVGLDAHYSAQNPGLSRRILGPAFDGESVDYLAGAYADTYGIAFDPRLLLASHVSTLRMSLQALVSIGVMGQLLAMDRPPPGLLGGRWLLERALDVATVGMGVESMLLAYVNPIPPSPWLVEAVDAALDAFPAAMREAVETGFRDYPDYNLDTGRVEATPEHPVTVATVERLRALRTGSPRLRYPGGPARVG
jgi:hypothetical protein